MPVLEDFEKEKERIRREKPYLSEAMIEDEALHKLIEKYGDEILRLLVEKARKKGWKIWVIPPPYGAEATLALGIEDKEWTLKIGVPGGLLEVLGHIIMPKTPWTIEQVVDYVIEHEYGHQRLAPAKIPFAPVGTYESMVASIVEDHYIDKFLITGLSKEILEKTKSSAREMVLKAPPLPKMPVIQVSLRTLTPRDVKRHWKEHKVIIDAKEVLEGIRKVADLKPAYEKILKLLWRYRKELK